MYYIGIDPGVKKSAFCVINDDKKIIEVGFLNSLYISEIHNLSKKYHGRVILEKPDRVDSKSTLKDILNLMFVVGQIACVFIVVVLVTPVQWKGQTKKEHTKRRVIKRIPGIVTQINKFPKSQQHNLYDAAGLALYGRNLTYENYKRIRETR